MTVKEMIEQGRWKELIREIPIKKGDFIRVDPSLVHAIQRGTYILAIQLSSDVTYRISNFVFPENKMCELISCRYYRVWQLKLSGRFSFEQIYPFLIVSVTEGTGLLNGQFLQKGDHLILPADYGRVDMQGNAEIIFSSVNE